MDESEIQHTDHLTFTYTEHTQYIQWACIID